MQYLSNPLTLACPSKTSRQCRIFCRSHVQKSTKNPLFTAFCSILMDFPINLRPKIWQVDNPPNLICPFKISHQCHFFCRSHAQKSIKNRLFREFSAFSKKNPDIGNIGWVVNSPVGCVSFLPTAKEPVALTMSLTQNIIFSTVPESKTQRQGGKQLCTNQKEG